MFRNDVCSSTQKARLPKRGVRPSGEPRSHGGHQHRLPVPTPRARPGAAAADERRGARVQPAAGVCRVQWRLRLTVGREQPCSQARPVRERAIPYGDTQWTGHCRFAQRDKGCCTSVSLGGRKVVSSCTCTASRID